MNSGYVLGVVRQGGRPLADALIGLDWVRGGGQPLTLYGPDVDTPSDRLRGIARGDWAVMPPPAVNLNATTNGDGAFVIPFQWSGTDLGTAMDDPQCQIFVLVEERTAGYVTMRLRGRFRARMVRTVSLSQASGGLIPNPTSGADLLGMGTDLATVLRSIRRPMIGLTVAAPSADMYAIVGGYRIAL